LKHEYLRFLCHPHCAAPGNLTTQTHHEIQASQTLLSRAKYLPQQSLGSIAIHRQPLDFSSDY
jgi:hypothetical protein